MNRNVKVYKNPEWFNPINRFRIQKEDSDLWKDKPSWQEIMQQKIAQNQKPVEKSWFHNLLVLLGIIQ
jgi:hypothetical protein